MNTADLRSALYSQTTALKDISDHLRDNPTVPLPPSAENHLFDAVELLRALNRLLDGRSIYQAFRAPGDWGYETPIGAALAELYRQPGFTKETR